MVLIIAGIPHGCRARSLLFQTASIQKKGSAYPSIGQKKLSGAAARMMIYFCVVESSKIAANHPSEENTSGVGNRLPWIKFLRLDFELILFDLFKYLVLMDDQSTYSDSYCLVNFLEQSFRWISTAFAAVVKMATVFAEHGPGRMGKAANKSVEAAYMDYRSAYNSP